MNDARWTRIKELFAQAIEQSPESRAAWLAQACDDADLRREVVGLLEADLESGTFLEQDVLDIPEAARVVVDATRGAAPPAGEPPARFGEYRIVRELGRGGMGVVYLAARDDDRFDKLVAIKVMAGDLSHPAVFRRFLEERRILASLDHPDIARLLDAGTSAAGAPYVVMEYVQGEPIDVYCASRELPLRERLELFARVCDAVQYSHEHLVVHRDIKARNVLVTAEGAPKLLDFGIAKLLEPGVPDRHVTRTAFRALTPESASPEQVRGEAITVATDVYSLGVLSYRLLTGRSPYRGDMITDSGVVRAICDEEPLKPSATPGLAHGRALRGDPDLIVLKALRKDPARRYSSVEQFARDIRRHLDSLPILAAPDAWTYRLRKFTGRHRLGLAAAAALGLVVAAGTLSTARQAQIARRERARAEGRFDDVRLLANAFMFEVHDAIQNLPGSIPARRLLITRVLEYLEKLDRDADGASVLELEIATAYQKVGNVQGNPYYANIGDYEGARRSYDKALSISRKLVDSDANAPNRAALATSHHLVADMLWAAGSFAEALEHYRLAITLRAALSAADVTSESKQLDLAASHYGVGQALLRSGDYKGAADAFSQSRTLRDAVAERNPSNLQARHLLATTAAKLGDVMAVQGDHHGALEYHSKAMEILQKAAAADPLNMPTRRVLSALLYRVSNDHHEMGDYQAALATGRRALDLQKSMVESDPSNFQARSDMAETQRCLGQSLAALNQPRQALEQLDAAEKSLKAVLLVSRDADAAGGLGMILLARGDVLASLGEVSRAIDAYIEATRLFEGQKSREETNRYRGMAHEHAGDMERRLAATAPASPEGQEHLRAACRHYQQGLEAVQLRQGALRSARDVAAFQSLSKKAAGCTAALR